MKRPRHTGKFNPKRAIIETDSSRNLQELARSISYGGNPEHKRNPGDFGLHPPSSPRPDKSLCDSCGITTRLVAERVLREGAMRGMLSCKEHGGYPQNIWAVTHDGIALEAQLENSATGRYHGYPMPAADPFREKVLERWENYEK